MKVLIFWIILQRVSAEDIFVILESGVENQFTNVEKLGEGSFGVVFKGEWVENDGITVAIKISSSDKANIQILTEVKFYKHLGAMKRCAESVNAFARAMEAGVPEVFDSGTVVNSTLNANNSQPNGANYPNFIGQNVLIMELVGSNLHEASKEVGCNFVKLNSDWLKVGFEMFRAITFLHSMGVIHGDIKPENFAFRRGETLRLCILDLGAARKVEETYSGSIHGSMYFHSFHLTNLVLQFLNWLPKKIIALKHAPDMKDDLESFVMSLCELKQRLKWEIHLKNYTICNEVTGMEYSKLSKEELQEMNKEEKKVLKLTPQKREDYKKNALLKMLKSKKGFPGQILAKFASENIPDAIKLLRDIVLYARSVTRGRITELQGIVDDETNFMGRWKTILENYPESNSTQISSSNFQSSSNVNDLQSGTLTKGLNGKSQQKKGSWVPRCLSAADD